MISIPTTPISRNKPYNPRKRILVKYSVDPSYQSTTTDGINEPQSISPERKTALRSSPDDIEEHDIVITIAPPCLLKYVSQRPSILRRPATNQTVVSDTVQDFISHQAQNIKDIQHQLDTYAHRRLSACRSAPQGLAARLKAHMVIKAEAEAMLKCLPEEQPPFSFMIRSLSRDSMGEVPLRLLHRPSEHIYVSQIDSATLATNALPTDITGFSSGNIQQEEVHSHQGLLELFRALLHKANHSYRGSSSSSSSVVFPFLLPGAAASNQQNRLRDLSSLEHYEDHQEGTTSWTASSGSAAANAALKALQDINVNAADAYIALCEALQESLNTRTEP